MQISEIFYSLQGEGFYAGLPSVFIRLAGCPLHCRWCDTDYAADPGAGRYYSVDAVAAAAQRFGCRFVVVTGGEPMINPDLTGLLRELKAHNNHITIETAGIRFIPDLACDLMSISPKLSNSTPRQPDLAAIHEKARLNIPAVRELIDNYEYQFKFVVDSRDDLPEIEQTLAEIPNADPEKVMLMPQAKTRDELIAKSPMVAEMCKQTGFAFSQCLHILLWNNARGS